MSTLGVLWAYQPVTGKSAYKTRSRTEQPHQGWRPWIAVPRIGGNNYYCSYFITRTHYLGITSDKSKLLYNICLALLKTNIFDTLFLIRCCIRKIQYQNQGVLTGDMSSKTGTDLYNWRCLVTLASSEGKVKFVAASCYDNTSLVCLWT